MEILEDETKPFRIYPKFLPSPKPLFTKYNLAEIPLGLLRYMVHGFPEITAYFVAALGGGMLGTGLMRHGIKDKLFLTKD